MDQRPSDVVADRVGRLAGARPVRWDRVSGGGYSPAERWRVTFEDGTTAFAKVGVSEDTSSWIRVEATVYEGVRGAFMPRFIGWDDHATGAVLVLEDLSGWKWPPPWTEEEVEDVLDALEGVRRSPPPGGIPRLEDLREDLSGWSRVAADPRPFLSLRLCSSRWLDATLPTLLAAERRVSLGGDQLLHLDVRSDNICFRGGRAVLVDWNWACVGNAEFDLAFWLPSLHAEGGPRPEDLLPRHPELAAAVAGYFASHAGLPIDPAAPRVREVQLAQLRSALPWASRALHLPRRT